MTAPAPPALSESPRAGRRLLRPARLSLLGLLAALFLAGCAAHPPSQEPANRAWLGAQQRQAAVGAAGAGQTAPSPAIEAMARRILEAGDDDLERMRLALGLLVQEFAYDPAYARRQFTRSAAELFESRILGGCSDYALAGLALFRAMGHPCMLVVTVSSTWLERRAENPLAVGYGHSFIEVMVDGRWHLADPNHFVLYGDYDPKEPFYPHRELFMARGWDFHDLGLRSTADAEAMLQRQALRPQPAYRAHSMHPRVKVELDLPALFVGLGDILAGKNDFLALKRYTRALDFAPDHGPAFLARGRLRLRLGELDAALADLNRAVTLLPDSAEAWRLRAKVHERLGREALAGADRRRAAALAAKAPASEAIESPDPPEAPAASGRLEK